MDDALVVGESLVDVVRSADGSVTERPGGSAANVAVALARLGRPVRLATAYADDERGGLLARHLGAAGVAVVGEPHVVPRTPVAEARIGADGAASYDFDLDWRLGPVDVGSPRWLHVCSLGAVLAPGADEVAALLAPAGVAGAVSYDVNARPALTGTGPDLVAAVERVARLAGLVKASDEDLAALYPTLEVDEAAAHLRALGPRVVVVTRGADGASWYAEGPRVDVAAPPADVVDTIGAGDAFMAALLDALWDDLDRDPRAVLEHAVRAGAVAVSRPGADPAYRHEL